MHQCKNCNDIVSSKNILTESDLVIENLNSIIDSHCEQAHVHANSSENKNLVQSFLKKSESFKKLASFSKKNSNNQQLDPSHTQSSASMEKILTNRLDAENSCPHLNTISKKDKFKSKSYFINSVDSSSPSVPANLRKFFFSNSSSNTISGGKTKKANENAPKQQYSSYVSTPRKKRTSLFNLFSFNKSFSSSSQNLNSTEANSPPAENYNSVDYDNVFADNEERQADKREQGDCAANSEWHKNLTFFTNKKSYKVSSEQQKALSKNSENSSLLSVKSIESLAAHENAVSRKPSIRCKGFSIPLNAAYCPNSTLRDSYNEHNDENKLSIRLRYAEIKQIDDEFNDENHSLKETASNQVNNSVWLFYLCSQSPSPWCTNKNCIRTFRG
jgi:hypothetical protein